MKLINVMASSIDGYIATQEGEGEKQRRALGFSNDTDKRHVEALLRSADAVIVGAESIRAAGQVWELQKTESQPHWYVFSEKGFPDSHKFWQQHKVTRFLVTKQGTSMIIPGGSGVQALIYGSEDPAVFIKLRCEQQKYKQVLLFGGGKINQIFYNANLVDELIVTICPFLVGSLSAARLITPPLNALKELELASSQVIGNHVFLKYSLKK